MKDLILVRIFSVILYLSSSISASSFVRLERTETLDNYTCTGSSLVFNSKSVYRTLLDCIATCLTYSTCHGIFYAANRHWCRGCTEDIGQGLGNPDIIEANVFTQFYLRANPSSHGVPCSSGMTCDVNQYCAATGICTCNPGFSYSPTMDRCNTGCLIQGSTYEKHTQKKIRDNHVGEYINISLQDCKDRCTAQTYCRTMDYRGSDSKCFLKSATALTAPEEFRSSTSKVHYHRNCA